MSAKSFLALAAVIAAAIIAIVVGIIVSPETEFSGATITLIYTGDTYGQLESCG